MQNKELKKSGEASPDEQQRRRADSIGSQGRKRVDSIGSIADGQTLTLTIKDGASRNAVEELLHGLVSMQEQSDDLKISKFRGFDSSFGNLAELNGRNKPKWLKKRGGEEGGTGELSVLSIDKLRTKMTIADADFR